jgi:hypothetical protein
MIVAVDIAKVGITVDGQEVPPDTVIELGGYKMPIAEFRALPPVQCEVHDVGNGPRLFVLLAVSGAHMVPLEKDLPSLADLYSLFAPTEAEKAERRRTFWQRVPGAPRRELRRN